MAVQLQNEHATNWASWVNDFDRTYHVFQQTLERVTNYQSYVRSRHPEWNNQYSILLNRGNQLAEQMRSLKRMRDRIANWLQSIGHAVSTSIVGTLAWIRQRFGLGSPTMSLEGCQCDNLGAIPVIVYVAISVTAAAAALAAAARWITETEQMNARISAAQRYEAGGMSPAEAARQVATVVGDDTPLVSAEGVLGIPWLYVGLGAAALLVVPGFLGGRAVYRRSRSV